MLKVDNVDVEVVNFFKLSVHGSIVYKMMKFQKLKFSFVENTNLWEAILNASTLGELFFPFRFKFSFLSSFYLFLYFIFSFFFSLFFSFILIVFLRFSLFLFQ